MFDTGPVLRSDPPKKNLRIKPPEGTELAAECNAEVYKALACTIVPIQTASRPFSFCRGTSFKCGRVP
jgi:hypothetical protein